MAATEDQDKSRTLQEAQISKALGLFLLIFALVVLVSILFTDTGIGKLTNLGAGIVLAAIGGIMLLRVRKTGRKQA
ncbi:MAG: hypothetical protein FJ280_06535 [Planctomycetes bacterium]|nr:hypothetical protein [Planctomycetota bacterium]